MYNLSICFRRGSLRLETITPPSFESTFLSVSRIRFPGYLKYVKTLQTKRVPEGTSRLSPELISAGEKDEFYKKIKGVAELILFIHGLSDPHLEIRCNSNSFRSSTGLFLTTTFQELGSKQSKTVGLEAKFGVPHPVGRYHSLSFL